MEMLILAPGFQSREEPEAAAGRPKFFDSLEAETSKLSARLLGTNADSAGRGAGSRSGRRAGWKESREIVNFVNFAQRPQA